MASPEEIAPFLPETLPDDFGEWDSEGSPAPETALPGEWEAWEAAHTHGDPSKSGKQTADRAAFLASLTDRPRVWNSASSSAGSTKQQKEVVDWDSEAPSSPSTIKSNEWEAWVAAHSFDTAPKPPAQSVKREATVTTRPSGAAAADKPYVSGPVTSAPGLVEQQDIASAPADGSPSPTSREIKATHATNEIAVKPSPSTAAVVDEEQKSPKPAAKAKREKDAALLQLFAAKTAEAEEDQTPAKKKRMIIAGVGAGSIALLAILSFTLLRHGSNPAVKAAVQPVSAATDPQPNTQTPNQQSTDPQSSAPRSANSSSAPVTQNQPVATTEKPSANGQPGSLGAGTKPAQAPTKTHAPTKTQANDMNDQLTAPTRIPQGNAEQVAENAPPAGFGAAGADGLGGTNGDASPFDGRGQPAVKVVPAKAIVISSGVAAGMLVEKTLPVYPAIAKSARVSGTVELHATISKSGMIKDLHVVSGSPMLQQAALDAVRTWRYKPYLLNNAPTEVDTTIRVVFSPIK